MTVVGWFSGGVSSFIACMLANPDRCVYIDVADQHPDTLRFVGECAEHIPCGVEVIRCAEYRDVADVISRARYVNGPYGARCTLELKKRVREAWERENLEGPTTYVWGYDADETARAERLESTMVEFAHSFPLIERGLTKADCHMMLERMKIARPAMYDLGYPNNNCIGCVKGGMGYWNKIREDFPDVFAARAALEREVGHSCLKGVFLDELEPGRGRNNPVVPSCSLACALAEGTM